MTLRTCALLELEERRPLHISDLEAMMANRWRKDIEIEDRELEDIVDNDDMGLSVSWYRVLRMLGFAHQKKKDGEGWEKGVVGGEREQKLAATQGGPSGV